MKLNGLDILISNKELNKMAKTMDAQITEKDEKHWLRIYKDKEQKEKLKQERKDNKG